MPGNLTGAAGSAVREGLYISRVPTVVTLNQLEAESDQKKQLRCNAADLKKGLLPMLQAPLMPPGAFCSKKRISSFGNLVQAAQESVSRVFLIADGSSDTDDSELEGFTRETSPVTHLRSEVFGGFRRPDGQPSAFEARALAAWDAAEKGGLFRYSVAKDTETRVLPGPYNFVAQVNEGRSTKKRPSEFRVDCVVQPFDPVKFNFQKAAQNEVLFALDFDPERQHAEFDPRTPVYHEGRPSPHLVFINVSPIEYGHLLLVPSVTESLPQVVRPADLSLALHMAAAADNPFFRVGFNSLGAYATINHLHFQGYFLPHSFPCERAPVRALCRVGRVAVGHLEDYPVNGVVFEANNCLDELAQVAGSFCARLSEENIPHNLMIFDRGARVMVFPQCFAEKQARGEVPQDILETDVNPACFEIAGHIVYKRREDFVCATQESACRLLAEVSLPEGRFAEVLSLLA